MSCLCLGPLSRKKIILLGYFLLFAPSDISVFFFSIFCSKYRIFEVKINLEYLLFLGSSNLQPLCFLFSTLQFFYMYSYNIQGMSILILLSKKTFSLFYRLLGVIKTKTCLHVLYIRRVSVISGYFLRHPNIFRPYTMYFFISNLEFISQCSTIWHPI